MGDERLSCPSGEREREKKKKKKRERERGIEKDREREREWERERGSVATLATHGPWHGMVLPQSQGMTWLEFELLQWQGTSEAEDRCRDLAGHSAHWAGTMNRLKPSKMFCLACSQCSKAWHSQVSLWGLVDVVAWRLLSGPKLYGSKTYPEIKFWRIADFIAG